MTRKDTSNSVLILYKTLYTDLTRHEQIAVKQWGGGEMIIITLFFKKPKTKIAYLYSL